MKTLHIEYKRGKPLSRKLKALFTVLSVVFIGIGLFTLISEVGTNKASWASIISGICNSILGVIFYMQAWAPDILEPRKYFRMDENAIRYKLWRFKKEKHFEWKEVREIDLNDGKLVFLMNSEKKYKVGLRYMPVSDVRKIRRSIEILGKEQGLLRDPRKGITHASS